MNMAFARKMSLNRTVSITAATPVVPKHQICSKILQSDVIQDSSLQRGKGRRDFSSLVLSMKCSVPSSHQRAVCAGCPSTQASAGHRLSPKALSISCLLSRPAHWLKGNFSRVAVSSCLSWRGGNLPITPLGRQSKYTLRTNASGSPSTKSLWGL